MALQQWNDEQFEQGILSEMLTVVDFSATWCGPCKKLHPIIEELAKEYEGKIQAVEVDVGIAQKTAAKYNVFSVPQIIFFRAGERLATMNGLQSKGKIAEQIERLLV
ncbi:MAG: thioredoxin [bacterium]|nr:thioredoxin [bacterium]